jgi:hypothetical protein
MAGGVAGPSRGVTWVGIVRCDRPRGRACVDSFAVSAGGVEVVGDCLAVLGLAADGAVGSIR